MEGICSFVLEQNYYELIMIGIIFYVMYLALRFMFYKMFKLEGYIAAIKTDTMGLMLSIILIILVTTLPAIFCRLKVNFEGIDMVSNYEQAMLYKGINWAYDVVKVNVYYFKYVYYISSLFSILAGTSFGVSVSGLMLSASPMIALSMLSSAFAILGNLVQMGFINSTMIYTLILGAQTKTFMYLIPLGLVLRMFPFARKIGGTILAIAIVLSLVLPLSYGFIFSFAYEGPGHPFNDPLEDISANFDKIYSPTAVADAIYTLMFTFYGAMWMMNLTMATINYVLIGMTGVLFLLSLMLVFFTYTDIFILVVGVAIKTVLLPLIAIFITVYSIRSMSRLFGTEVDVMGIMRVV